MVLKPLIPVHLIPVLQIPNLGYTNSLGSKDILSKKIIKRLIDDISKYLFNLDVKTLEVLVNNKQ